MTKKKKRKIIYGSVGAGIVVLIGVIIGVTASKSKEPEKHEVQQVKVENGGVDNLNDDLSNKETIVATAPNDGELIEASDEYTFDENLFANDEMTNKPGSVIGSWASNGGSTLVIEETDDGLKARMSFGGESTYMGTVETDNKTYIKILRKSLNIDTGEYEVVEERNLVIKDLYQDDSVDPYMVIEYDGGTYNMEYYQEYVPAYAKQAVADGMFDDYYDEEDDGEISPNSPIYEVAPVEDEGGQEIPIEDNNIPIEDNNIPIE